MSLKSSIKLLLVAVVALQLAASCDKARVFDAYKEVGNGWHKDSIVSFELPELDPNKTYDLFVNVRGNNKYPFSNLFLIVSMDMPGGVTKVDTLEYPMADAEGHLLGEGFTDVKDSKLAYKTKVRFKAGKYTVHIRHAARETGKIAGVEKLEGITDVGFRIEKTK